MKTERLIREIEEYEPSCEQEEKDRALMLSLIKSEDVRILTRDCEAFHFTASAWTVNGNMDKVLMAYHKIYDSWAWLGGHADGEEDLSKTALREVTEESGVSGVKLARDGIFSLEILPVSGHVKKGKYVSSHLHLNLTYLVVADENEPLKSNPGENSAVAWFTPEDALSASSEEWFKERVYKKLIEKCALLKK